MKKTVLSVLIVLMLLPAFYFLNKKSGSEGFNECSFDTSAVIRSEVKKKSLESVSLIDRLRGQVEKENKGCSI